MNGSQAVPTEVPMRPIAVTVDALKFGNIEAWINIIESYRERHPDHTVHIWYRGERVNSLIGLFKIPGDLDRDGFAVEVDLPDNDWTDVAKLYRLLAEGAGSEYRRFIDKELFQILRLF